ncbi:hypothetical protein D9619_012356 [Psilocybe cf. subviscida]|uniref:Uncharacterized protein n=1 Tax=Psilocybe cf. subviscida TaxID=2480587 RepID=A0A8H5ERA0_9AGAR|nr:hypothetical protein D9619_012356 [Psilocybe cf. subviscida]
MMKPCIEDKDLQVILRAVPTLRTLTLELTEDNRSHALFKCLSQKDLDRPGALHLIDPFLPLLERLDLVAPAPRHWKTFIEMFADDATLSGEEFAQTRPRRHALQVTFKAQSGVHRSRMDLISLSQLVVLWEKYRFFAVFHFDDEDVPSATKESFLIESYRYRSLSLPRPLDEQYIKLQAHLTVLSSLSF